MTRRRVTKDERDRLTGPGLRTFFAIAREWGLDEAGQMRLLGIADDGRLERRHGENYEEVTGATLLRVSYLLGIYQAARMITADAGEAAAWINSPVPEPPCSGRSPLAMATSGRFADLKALRRWLDTLW